MLLQFGLMICVVPSISGSKDNVQDKSMTVGTTRSILNETLLITCAIKKELKF